MTDEPETLDAWLARHRFLDITNHSIGMKVAAACGILAHDPTTLLWFQAVGPGGGYRHTYLFEPETGRVWATAGHKQTLAGAPLPVRNVLKELLRRPLPK